MADATGDPFGESQEPPSDEDQIAQQKVNSGIVDTVVKSRTDRFKGAEAASIGLVLGGCVAVGYFGGQWLDNRFHTAYWMPVGLLFGVVAGFRELFHTIQRLNEQAQRERDERKRNNARTGENVTGEFRKTKGAPLTPEVAENPIEPARMFPVPAPPSASFEKREKPAPSVPAPTAPQRESLEELTQRLLQEGGAAEGVKREAKDE